MVKKLLIGFVVLVAGFLVVVALQPATYHVERSISVNAPPEVVWADVSDFNRWKSWNPWQKSNPQQEVVKEVAQSKVKN